MRTLAIAALLAALLAVAAVPSSAQQRRTGKSAFDQVAAQAEAARAANRVDDAIQLYHRGVTLRPQWAEGWWYLGTLLYEKNAFAEAAIAFDKATTLNPKVGTAWLFLGLCEFQLERYDDALKHIRRGRALGGIDDPQLDQVTLYHEGILLLGKGDFDEAQETLGKLSSLGAENENLIAALGLAVLRLRFSDLVNGDTTMREVIRRAGIAEQLTARKRFDEALAEYTRLVADYPKTPNVQFALGRFLLRSGQDENAVEAFKREIENSPSHLMARVGIADTKFRMKDFEGALPYAEEIAKLAPALPNGHYLLGAILLGAGQSDRALAELEAARAALPNEAKIYFQLARAYAQVGRKDDAARARATFARLSREQEAADLGTGASEPSSGTGRPDSSEKAEPSGPPKTAPKRARRKP